MTDVDGVDASRAARQEDIRKSPGRRPQIEAGASVDIDIEVSQGVIEFDTAARRPWMDRSLDLERRLGGNSPPGFVEAFGTGEKPGRR